MKKKKLLEIIKFVGVFLVILSVIVSLFMPFMV